MKIDMRKCDCQKSLVCGHDKYYKPSEVVSIVFEEPGFHDGLDWTVPKKTFDICPACLELQFNRWLHEQTQNDRDAIRKALFK